MPTKNSIKQFVSGGAYHLYNTTGGRQTLLFTDDHDYLTFISLLSNYLSPEISSPPANPHPFLSPKPPSIFKPIFPSRLRQRQLMNLHSQVTLLAFCLMPDHFHLLARQFSPTGITKLIRRLCTSYSMYFNHRHHQSGKLFRNIYKAAPVKSATQLLHVSRYIHLNPISFRKIGPLTATSGSPAKYPYSSFQYYSQNAHPDWLDTSTILTAFQATTKLFPHHYQTYTQFVLDYNLDSKHHIPNLLLDN